MTDFRRILVPVDYSPGSRLALRYAAGLARGLDAKLEVLHAWEPPLGVPPTTPLFVPGRGPRTVAQLREEAQQELAAFLAAADELGGLAVTGRLEQGEPVEVIGRVARGGFDLIVMGTHGRRGLAHLLLGSVAERMLRLAPCPIVTVREPSPAEAHAP